MTCGILVLDRGQQPVLGPEQPHHGDAVDLELGVLDDAAAGSSVGQGSPSDSPPPEQVGVDVEHGLTGVPRRC